MNEAQWERGGMPNWNLELRKKTEDFSMFYISIMLGCFGLSSTLVLTPARVNEAQLERVLKML